MAVSSCSSLAYDGYKQSWLGCENMHYSG